MVGRLPLQPCDGNVSAARCGDAGGVESTRAADGCGYCGLRFSGSSASTRSTTASIETPVVSTVTAS